MKVYWWMFVLLLSGAAQASDKLGVEFFSLIEKEQNQLYLQVGHYSLGAGPREAFFKLEGCTDEALWLEVRYNDQGLRLFTETPIERCDFNKRLELGLYFEENGEKRLFNVYEEKPVRYLVPENKDLLFICLDGSLYATGMIPPSLQGSKLAISYKQGDVMVEFEKLRVLFGYYFDFKLYGDFDCSEISGGYINDTFFPKFEIPGW